MRSGNGQEVFDAFAVAFASLSDSRCIDDAIWYAQREFECISRYCGLSHTYSRTSLMCLELLKKHKEVMQEEQECELQLAA